MGSTPVLYMDCRRRLGNVTVGTSLGITISSETTIETCSCFSCCLFPMQVCDEFISALYPSQVSAGVDFPNTDSLFHTGAMQFLLPPHHSPSHITCDTSVKHLHCWKAQTSNESGVYTSTDFQCAEWCQPCISFHGDNIMLMYGRPPPHLFPAQTAMQLTGISSNRSQETRFALK